MGLSGRSAPLHNATRNAGELKVSHTMQPDCGGNNARGESPPVIQGMHRGEIIGRERTQPLQGPAGAGASCCRGQLVQGDQLVQGSAVVQGLLVQGPAPYPSARLPPPPKVLFVFPLEGRPRPRPRAEQGLHI